MTLTLSRVQSSSKGADFVQATSQEIRKQIVEAKYRGESSESIMLWTNVSKSTIDKVWSRYKKTGSSAAIPYVGRLSRITPELEMKIRGEIAVNSDITLEELIDKLGLPIQKSQLSKLLIAWGLSFKKRHCTPRINCAKMFKKSEKNGDKAKTN